MRKTVSSGSPLEDPIGFSRACRIGDYISVSGTAPIYNGETVHIDDVFSKIKPACTFVEVSRFIDEKWLVETEIDCVVM